MVGRENCEPKIYFTITTNGVHCVITIGNRMPTQRRKSYGAQKTVEPRVWPCDGVIRYFNLTVFTRDELSLPATG